MSVDSAVFAGFQRNSSTGNKRQIRRRLVSGPIVLWRWQGDGPERAWHAYAYDISIKLERMKKKYDEEGDGAEEDLQSAFNDCPYTLDVVKVVFSFFFNRREISLRLCNLIDVSILTQSSVSLQKYNLHIAV